MADTTKAAGLCIIEFTGPLLFIHKIGTHCKKF